MNHRHPIPHHATPERIGSSADSRTMIYRLIAVEFASYRGILGATIAANEYSKLPQKYSWKILGGMYIYD